MTTPIRVILVAALITGTAQLAVGQPPAGATVPHFAGPRPDAPIPRPGLTLQSGRVALVHRWRFGGALETLMHKIGMFDRPRPDTPEAFTGSGADWLEQYRRYLEDGRTVITSPHKVFGPETNDLVLQLRKAGISQVILAGMSANLCTESHLRELVEQGFEVVVVTDATAAAKLPGFDGYEAAFVNFRLIASDVWSTHDAVTRMAGTR
ncbi:MAG: isochorismatase family protein [Gemmatimonadales bacterium]|nr:isochorismatase family protein [Gemmatimonadales bacterium]